MNWRDLVKMMLPGKKYSWNDIVKMTKGENDNQLDVRTIRAIITAAGSYIDKAQDTGNYYLTRSGVQYRERMGWDQFNTIENGKN